MTGVGVAGRGGPASSGLFPPRAVRQVSPGAPRPREGQRDQARPTLGPADDGGFPERVQITDYAYRRIFVVINGACSWAWMPGGVQITAARAWTEAMIPGRPT